MVMLSELHAAALGMSERLTEELRKEREKEEVAIADATRSHLYIGEKYWERRHMIEKKLRAVNGFLNIVE